jgi:hypothetical protein
MQRTAQEDLSSETQPGIDDLAPDHMVAPDPKLWIPVISVKPNETNGSLPWRVNVSVDFEQVYDCDTAGTISDVLACAADTMVDIFNSALDKEKKFNLTSLQFKVPVAVSSVVTPKDGGVDFFLDGFVMSLGISDNKDKFVQNVANYMKRHVQGLFDDERPSRKRSSSDAGLAGRDEMVWVPVIKCGPAKTTEGSNEMEWNMCMTWEVKSDGEAVAFHDSFLRVVKKLSENIDVLQVDDKFKRFRVIYEVRGDVGILSSKFPRNAVSMKRFGVDKSLSANMVAKAIGLQLCGHINDELEWQKQYTVPE